MFPPEISKNTEARVVFCPRVSLESLLNRIILFSNLTGEADASEVLFCTKSADDGVVYVVLECFSDTSVVCLL